MRHRKTAASARTETVTLLSASMRISAADGPVPAPPPGGMCQLGTVVRRATAVAARASAEAPNSRRCWLRWARATISPARRSWVRRWRAWSSARAALARAVAARPVVTAPQAKRLMPTLRRLTGARTTTAEVLKAIR
ncbi:hypothetical protein CTZ27_11810 [Streptomyces griseocarneus]|nr:hypothetical protein CTZ27_11810 [Streptomyces griseocarneus]